MKKILQINPQVEIIGGMERYIENFYETFSGKYDIKILTYTNGKNNTILNNDKIFSLKEKEDYGFFSKIKRLYTRSKNIAIFCKENNIDILISNGDNSNIFSIISKFFGNKAKVITIIHNSLSKKTLGIVTFYLAKRLYKYSNSVISVSNELSEEIKKITNLNNIKTIYNPFNLEKINSLINTNQNDYILDLINNSNINICYISRIEEQKNQLLLLDYIYEFTKNYNKEVQLFLIGNSNKSNYIQKLESKIKEFGLENNVHFLGHKDNIYKFIKLMNFSVFLGTEEGFGRVLIDSICIGIPVLTHDYKYGAKEIIRNNNDFSSCNKIEIHENGIITPFMDKEKFIEAMNLITETKFNKQKMIENCYKYDINNFEKSWNLILENV